MPGDVLVPVSKIDLVQKYIGAGGDVTPKPDKLGSKAFSRRKAQVAAGGRTMAATANLDRASGEPT